MWTPNTRLPLAPTAERAVPAPPVPTSKDGGQLFASELQRASGTGKGGEGHRDARQAGEDRRASQARRAEAADTQRSEARMARQGAQQGRNEHRSERLATAERPVSATRPAAEPERSTRLARPEPRPEPTLPEAAKAPEAATKAPETPVTPEPSARAQVAIATPQAASPQRANVAPTASPAPAATETTLAVGPKPQRGVEPRAGDRPAPELPTDVLGELLLEREADLDRQASVLRQVRAQLGPGTREISLQLSPAALGQVQLRLSLRNGQLTGVLRASTPEALEALENQLPELTASLEAQGFEVVDFDLGLIPTEPRTH